MGSILGLRFNIKLIGRFTKHPLTNLVYGLGPGQIALARSDSDTEHITEIVGRQQEACEFVARHNFWVMRMIGSARLRLAAGLALVDWMVGAAACGLLCFIMHHHCHPIIPYVIVVRMTFWSRSNFIYMQFTFPFLSLCLHSLFVFSSFGCF